MKDFKEQAKYWKKSGEKDYVTAEYLFKGKRYDACLFYCHLSVEKLIKGLVVIETNENPPKIHDLAVLVNKAKIKADSEQLKYLRIITSFNIAGRYAESKFNLYKIATQIYTKQYLDISKSLIIWLKKQYR
jgi:HEPN domain-containing protein